MVLDCLGLAASGSCCETFPYFSCHHFGGFTPKIKKLRVKFCESRDWSNNHLLPFFKIAFEFCKIDKISLLFYIPISDGRRAFRTLNWAVGSSPGT